MTRDKIYKRFEEAKKRSKSQKWGDTGDKYEKSHLKRKRKKLQKKGR